MKNNKTKTIAGVGLLGAVTIVLTLISNFIQIGTISINLSLFPIVLAGILYGPFAGLTCGIINGLFVLLAPSTAAFFALTVPGTIIVCIVKTGFAGLVTGLIYKFIKNKSLAITLACILAPFINTTMFILLALIFFGSGFKELITIFVSINFAIEFGATIILTPSTKAIINNKKVNNQ